jgi:ABC-type transport system involved in multi-copper enzyme maturation permease subunit
MIRTIARLTLARLRRGRAVWAAFGIAMIPAMAAIVLRNQVRSEADRADMITALYVPQLLVLAVIPAMFIASSIGEEIEEKTITYLWSRPLARWHVIAGKLLALAPAAIAISLVGWLLAVQIGIDGLAPARTIIGLGAAALAISMVSAGISTLAPKHGMALTIIYMLLFDLPIGEIPASLQVLSVTHQARMIAGIRTLGVLPGSPVMPAITMAVIGIVWLAIGLWRIRRLEA